MTRAKASTIFAFLSLALLGAGCVGAPAPVPEPLPAPAAPAPIPPAPAPPVTEEKKVESVAAAPAVRPIAAPLDGASDRVTKKGFGLYVRPGDSPVSPERFKGYHTGVDFETTAAERDVDVPVRAICDGPLLLKERASGYGGVAVQACRIGAEDVTVVYGHLRLSSITATPHQSLTQGETIGVLGKGHSTETDGERKHLHLGIHKGTAIDIKGYVQNKADLGQWLDIRTYLAE